MMPAYTNAKQTIPHVFKEIIKNDNRCAEIGAKGAEMSQADWRELGALKRDKKTSLVPGAERALRHNTDKGNLA